MKSTAKKLPNGRFLIEGMLVKSDIPTLNGHIYSDAILKKAVADLQDKIKARTMIGRVGVGFITKTALKDTSHIVTDLKMDEGTMKAEVEVVDTLPGKALKALLESKVPVTINPVFLGIAEDDIVSEGVKLTNIDICSCEEAGLYEELKSD